LTVAHSSMGTHTGEQSHNSATTTCTLAGSP
jgi:hypothetical protein